jgi:hypothetical protein
MARRNVVLAQRQAPANKRRSRGRKRRATGEVECTRAPAFDDLAEAFFAAAPPDETAPDAAPDRFDDLVPVGPTPPDPLAVVRAGTRRAIAALRVALGRLRARVSAGFQRAARK